MNDGSADLPTPVDTAEAPAQGDGRAARLWFFGAVALLFVLLSLTYLLRPIMEPDFFWHLKTGEWIWQHQALPKADPFAFTGPQHPDSRQLLILQGYWLAQLIYHAVVAAAGLWGIFLLRVVLLALFFGLFLWMFERHRVNRLLAFSLLALFGIFFLENYALERPQVFTFLAIGLLVMLYRRLRDDRGGATGITAVLVAVFLLMTGWANLHGGVILGQAAIGVMLLVEFSTAVRAKDYGRFRAMLAFGGIALAGSFLAPAHLRWEDVMSLVGSGASSFGYSQSEINYEYYSIYTWLVVNRNFKLLIPLALCLASLAALKPAISRGNHLEAVLLAVFWLFAFRHVRYLPIAMVFSLLIVAWNYRPGSLPDYGAIFLLVGLGCSLWMWTSNEFQHFTQARERGLIEPSWVPVHSSDFLQQRGYKGRIFNTYNWGGYLLWRLSPEIQVAIDSRLLDEAVYAEMRRCEKLEKGETGRPYWKEVMDKYAINAAVLPLKKGSKPFLLTQSIAGDAEWQLVFSDQVSAVFMRKIPVELTQP